MSKKRLTLLSLLSLIFLAEISWGQQWPSGQWWQSRELNNKLELTDEHIHQLDTLYLANHSKLNQLKIALDDAELALDNLIGQKSMLDDEVRMQFDRLQEARANLANELLRFEVRLREIIGDERLEQLKAVYDKSGFGLDHTK